jgi:hypothetical protein
MRIPAPTLFALLILFASLPASAWENHTQLSDIALEAESWAATDVTAESLDSFLEEAKGRLGAVLAAVEKDAKADYPAYKPLPAALTFDPAASGEALRESFTGALRVNPTMPFPLFLQTPAGKSDTRPELVQEKVDLLGNRLVNGSLRGLEEGETVTALQVVETAADEPDYGMDIGLFENNGTAWGARYGFGLQPFGNPSLSYGSQAPFHMSFANEDGILKAAAPKYQGSYVGYRVDLYAALAREAFASGHAYWGWRFAGWALHYVEDAAMPYHSSLLPAKDTLGILLLNAFGTAAQIDGEVVLLSNRHVIMENYQYSVFKAYAGDDAASVLFAAAKGTGMKTVLPGDAAKRRWVLEVVAKRGRDRGLALDRAIVAAFPATYVADPAFDFGAWQAETMYAYDPRAELVVADAAKAKVFEAALVPSIVDLGLAARAFMATLAALSPN